MHEIELVPLDEGSVEEDERLETLAWGIDDLFDVCKIRQASYDEPVMGFACGDELVAALVGGAAQGDPWSGMRFSVCVHPDFRRQGLASRLVRAFIDHCEADGLPVEAWVVNEEAMIPMLEDLGFSRTDEAIWSL